MHGTMNTKFQKEFTPVRYVHHA